MWGKALCFAVAAVPAAAADLTVAVTGVGPVGQVRLQVFTDAHAFARLEGGLAAAVLPPLTSEARVTLHGLPAGGYAVAVFQDVDGDGRLDTDLFGRPTEPHALSGRAEAPDFAAAMVDMGEPGTVLSLRLR